MRKRFLKLTLKRESLRQLDLRRAVGAECDSVTSHDGFTRDGTCSSGCPVYGSDLCNLSQYPAICDTNTIPKG